VAFLRGVRKCQKKYGIYFVLNTMTYK